MGFNCGIVGLPNVGKSTLFNALTETAAAEAANYPFTTIEPNVGRVPVPDPRLDQLGRVAKSDKIVPTYLEFTDIAGLVRGASRGEGLGNQFLAQIREVDAIVHVLRCFDGEVTHVEGSVDPLRDAETVETELMLADLDSVERQLEAAVKRARGGEEEAKARLAVLEPVVAALREGRPAREVRVAKELEPIFARLHLLTVKPVLDVANVDEDSLAAGGNAYSERVARRARVEGEGFVMVSAAIEAEVAALSDPAERREFLESLGLEETGLDRVIRAGYELLDLITFFTTGPKEARAWTTQRGTPAARAAGLIHSDFERGFIRAETYAWDDFVACGGEAGAKDAGKMRSEGRDYVVRDGDVLRFRFNVVIIGGVTIPAPRSGQQREDAS
ncbi:MAG: redox-regulated ATPase YchF [Proteobacteria bacterium]|nr:redox-regulated ATPase YchF [Pseudomonadota bacterium]